MDAADASYADLQQYPGATPTALPYSNILQDFITAILYSKTLQQYPAAISYSNILQQYPAAR